MTDYQAVGEQANNAMEPRVTGDLDFLSARLHGRRSRMAEAERLDALCRIRTIPELARALFPDATLYTAVELQRHLVLDVVAEVQNLARQVGSAAGDLLGWIALRFQMENLKVLARAFSSGMSVDQVKPHLLLLPGELAMRTEPYLSAGSVEAFAALIASDVLASSVRRLAVEPYKRQPKPFFIESALDRGYLAELLGRAGRLPAAERDGVLAMARQETDTFHMMLVARGRFNYQVKAEDLVRFHVRGSGITRDDLVAMAGAADLVEVAERAAGHAIDAVPPGLRGLGEAGQRPDASVLEWLAGNRFYRVANRAFRQSHMGLGAVVAYTAIRRVELANLITLSEGVRVGLAPESIHRRLTPRRETEAARV